jgi:hypothetical protein
VGEQLRGFVRSFVRLIFSFIVEITVRFFLIGLVIEEVIVFVSFFVLFVVFVAFNSHLLVPMVRKDVCKERSFANWVFKIFVVLPQGTREKTQIFVDFFQNTVVVAGNTGDPGRNVP